MKATLDKEETWEESNLWILCFLAYPLGCLLRPNSQSRAQLECQFSDHLVILNLTGSPNTLFSLTNTCHQWLVLNNPEYHTNVRRFEMMSLTMYEMQALLAASKWIMVLK